MDPILVLGWLGIFSPVALGAIGSTLGCTIAGQAACGAMLDTETGHGRFVGLSALPSTQVVLGIVVMFTLNRSVTVENAPGIFAIGVLTGLALLFSAWFQGKSVAAAIYTAKNKPAILGLAVAPAAIVEGFSVFAFVFALVLSGSLPA